MQAAARSWEGARGPGGIAPPVAVPASPSRRPRPPRKAPGRVQQRQPCRRPCRSGRRRRPASGQTSSPSSRSSTESSCPRTRCPATPRCLMRRWTSRRSAPSLVRPPLLAGCLPACLLGLRRPECGPAARRRAPLSPAAGLSSSAGASPVRIPASARAPPLTRPAPTRSAPRRRPRPRGQAGRAVGAGARGGRGRRLAREGHQHPHGARVARERARRGGAAGGGGAAGSGCGEERCLRGRPGEAWRRAACLWFELREPRARRCC
jgi:hypothetical protein